MCQYNQKEANIDKVGELRRADSIQCRLLPRRTRFIVLCFRLWLDHMQCFKNVFIIDNLTYQIRLVQDGVEMRVQSELIICSVLFNDG